MCIDFINKVRESRCIMVSDMQVNKFNRLTKKLIVDIELIIAHNLQVVAIRCKIYIVPIMAIISLKIVIALKWVVNLSKTHLTPAQESLLSKGSNFAIAPNNPPNVDFITAIESVCHKLSAQDSQKCRAETSCLLKWLECLGLTLTERRRRHLWN